MSDLPLSARISPCSLIIAVHDLAGYTRAARLAHDLALAAFIEAYYELAAGAVRGAGGRVVKFIGDAVLAVFPDDQPLPAIAAMVQIREGIAALVGAQGPALSSIGAGRCNLHLAVVAAGELGPPGDRRYDLIGAGVNQCFLLGERQPPGVHISEPLYRLIPEAVRGRWTEQRMPALYTMADGG